MRVDIVELNELFCQNEAMEGAEKGGHGVFHAAGAAVCRAPVSSERSIRRSGGHPPGYWMVIFGPAAGVGGGSMGTSGVE